jgi:hypothetical protein
MRTANLAFVAILTLVATACGKPEAPEEEYLPDPGSETPTNPATPLTDTPRNEDGTDAPRPILIGNLKPEEFYQQFIFKKEETDQNPYTHLMTTSPTFLAATGAGDLYYTIKIYLFPNQQYLFGYEEGVYESGGEGLKLKLAVFKTSFINTWRVDGQHLIVGGLGVGEGFQVNGNSLLRLKLSADINTRGLKGSASELYYGRSAASPQESQTDLLDSGGLEWLLTSWERKDFKKGAESFHFSRPRKFRRLIFRTFKENGQDIRCRLEYDATDFTVDGQVVGGKPVFAVQYRLEGVQLASHEDNHDSCPSKAKAEKERIQEETPWEHLFFIRESDKLLKVSDSPDLTQLQEYEKK